MGDVGIVRRSQERDGQEGSVGLEERSFVVVPRMVAGRILVGLVDRMVLDVEVGCIVVVEGGIVREEVDVGREVGHSFEVVVGIGSDVDLEVPRSLEVDCILVVEEHRNLPEEGVEVDLVGIAEDIDPEVAVEDSLEELRIDLVVHHIDLDREVHHTDLEEVHRTGLVVMHHIDCIDLPY